MWKRLYRLAQRFLIFAQQAERNQIEIQELRHEVKELAGVVQRLIVELHRLRDHDAHEREKLALQLENALLRFERRLPPGRTHGS